jgi:hypothetical protein
MMNEEHHPSCSRCGRLLAEGLDEWDDSIDLLCFGEKDPLCEKSKKIKDPEND